MTRWKARIRASLGTFRLDVSLAGDDGVIAVIGPNGSGKSTLLRAIAGACPVDEAEVVVGGRVLASNLRGVDAPVERRRVGYVPQGYGLFDHLSVVDNVAFGLSTGAGRLPRRVRRERAATILDEIGCGDLGHRRVNGLSGGERQRVALARALIVEPDFLLLDEPLAALDAVTRRTVRRFLAERLRSFGRPSLLVTHDVRDVEALDATVVVLDNGTVMQIGTLASLRRAPASNFVSEFLGR